MPTPVPPLPVRTWQDGFDITELTPDYLRLNYLAGVDLGAALNGDAGDLVMYTALNSLVNDVQSKLGIRFQQQRVLTYPDPSLVQGTDYDILGEPLSFLRQSVGAQYYTIPLPYSAVQRIERVRMFYSNPGDNPTGQQILEVPKQWIVFTSKEGILKIVLSFFSSLSLSVNASSAILAYGPLFYRGLLPDDIPAVWAVDYWIGTGQVDADIARWICLSAAIQILGNAGAAQDLSHGLSSESLSQDGQTESITHFQGKWGPYSGMVETYRAERDALDIWKKRFNRKGIKVAVW